MIPDTPDSGTGDSELASIEEAMGEWNDDEQQDQQNADNPGDGDDQTDPQDGDPEQHADDPDNDGQSDDGADPGPDELTGGQFAPHTAKVTLPDGRVTTVAELLNGSMMRADYTQGKMALADERKAFEAEHSRVKSLDTELQQQREVLIALAEAMAPKRPDPSLIDTDLPTWTIMNEAYNAFQGNLNRLAQHLEGHKARTTQEMTAAQQRIKDEHRQQLAQRDKRFADRAWYTTFWNDAVKAGEYYGFTPQDLNTLVDHRHYLILRDALEYRKIRAANGKQKQNGQQRPVITGSQRPNGNANAQAQTEKARFMKLKSPSIHDAMKLNI